MRSKQRGVALIIVLWVVTVMGTFTMLFSRESRLALDVNKNLKDAAEAELLAEAGIHRVIAELVYDYENTISDHLSETWASNSEGFLDAPLGNGVFRIERPDLENIGSVAYGAVDESGKLNVNTATRQMLMALPEATDEIVDAILDWRDEDDDLRQFGAEFEYYESLDEPYTAKNAQFDTIDELLLVRGVTLDILYGEDTNANGTLDANENDGDASFPLDNADDQLDLGWIHFLTVYSYELNEAGDGSARVNINSADEEEMQELLGDVLSEDDIEEIIEARDQEEFQRIGDLLQRNAGGGGGGGRGGGGGGGSQSTLNRDAMREAVDRITVSDEQQLFGRVNLNTAPREVLTCLFPQREDIVEGIIEFRQSSDGPFESIGQLLDIDGVNDQTFADASERVSAKSSVFSVRSAGYIQTSNAYKQAYAIIDRGADPVSFLYWKVIR